MQLNGNLCSLYFHVPFCIKKCDYCHFYVIPDQQRYKDVYMRALQKEWALRHPLLHPFKVTSIYFGGGTPSLLSPQAIEKILFWISPPSDCEITLEANPEHLSLELMQAFRASGINRISLGVQSLDDSLLKTLSRTHSAKQALQAVEMSVQAGIENISIDLMYDVPKQTLKSWHQTLTLAMSLPLSHLSLYNLTIEPHTVFFKKKESLKLPAAETSLEMLQAAVATFETHGFERYEISAFAKEGKISRHNSGYWTQRPFLGFGPSAFSYWEGARFRNNANLNRYAKSLEIGEEPVDFKETLPLVERMKEGLAIGLRLIEGVLIQQWPATIKQGISELETLGLVEQRGNRLRLTPKGLLFHDTVAEKIMSY
jgi:oxygen-independent coproporphyrinogen III oxidase